MAKREATPTAPKETESKKGAKKADRVRSGAVPPEQLRQSFPSIRLAVRPPYPPMEAKSVAEIPAGPGWLYEPKWDGFRCLAFRRDHKVLLQSKAGQPLGRYFPELVAALSKLPLTQFVLDGEIVIFSGGQLSFDDLLMRIHPAASRVKKLAAETPATFMCFDLLVDGDGKPIVKMPLAERRGRLEKFFSRMPGRKIIRLSQATKDRRQAEQWMTEIGIMGFDGIVAKKLNEPYRSGERSAMVKIKRIRSAECVVGGFRYAESGRGIGSLLLGLYNDDGALDHVGFTSSFNAEQRIELQGILNPMIGGSGFTGRSPGGPSRWSTARSADWHRLKPKLVCEVSYDHFSGGRFRHGTKFLRWRPEKDPRQCTFEQLRPSAQKPHKRSAA